jgi:UDP-N-acetyl-D-mannosaminuronic acid dehydrogenase
MNYDVAIVGGAGHVGAPLAVVLASRGFRTLIYDLNEKAVASIMAGNFPFQEEGGEAMLHEALQSGRLSGTTRAEDLASVENLILTIGTPVDEFQNPGWFAVNACVETLLPHLVETKLIILRSTVSPGTTEQLRDFLARKKRPIPIAFCPERVVQGRAIEEIQRMPQIISGTSPEAEEQAAHLFGKIATSLVRLKPIEAEFSKLFCNAYRYIQFAASNQFYMMAHAAGCDFDRILAGIKMDYPRMKEFPGAGFAAGPCLLKDTLQLASSSLHSFELGHAAIRVNEGLPAFIVETARSRYPLKEMTVGILGMAFKAESDDRRSSLSYKLKKLLRLHAKDVLTTDPLVTDDPELLPLEEVLQRSELLIVGTPHRAYADIRRSSRPLLDVWGTPPPPPVSDRRVHHETH